MERKSIVLALPGRLYRDGIRHLLQSPDRIVVGSWDAIEEFGEACDGQDPPDVVVAGLGDHAADQLEYIRTLRAQWPSMRWILLGRSCDTDSIRAALDVGVDALILEDSIGEVLKLVIELVLLGHSCIPVELAKLTYGGVRQGHGGPVTRDAETSEGEQRASSGTRRDPRTTLSTAAQATRLPVQAEVITFRREAREVGPPSTARNTNRLSGREEQILGCLAQGLSNKLIARELQIAEATVKVHVKALLRKMQVSNRTKAALAAATFLGSSGVIAGRVDASSKIAPDISIGARM